MDNIPNHHQLLKRECQVFCRYLTGRGPTDYVIDKYVTFHNQHRSGLDHAKTIDRILLSLSRIGPSVTYLVDHYTGFFLRKGLFREKLVLVFAILECAPPYFADFDSPESRYPLIVYAKLLLRLAVGVVGLTLATILFLPLHTFSAVLSGHKSARRST